ncbi:phytanoyl-CoA dioxygenase family protein [uncultured Mucilaginibacter sp.]|uniref:phytanoyl-CoA dioxygenase family protein n=1 Tax=uncultured Mucilaginibacter sp. TaxID=797541 RepID=UPI0025E50CFC|nr:phytanoyl-CoA dioxygenase family protein [uncultured Mucilaginibacter sp.]
MPVSEIVPSSEMGKIKVMHLKRYWSKALLKRNGKLKQDALQEEWNLDTILLHTLGLGLEQTSKYVYQEVPDFEKFEDWILEVTGGPDDEKTRQFNTLFLETTTRGERKIEEVLTRDDLDFWNENGYLIVRNAVSKEDCDAVIAALCDYIGIDRNDPTTWYNHHPAQQGIMIQLFQHPALEKNRQSAKIRTVCEQLWQRTDIWPTTDRVSFNPPETQAYPFQGPRLHWDVSIDLPIPFGLQGLLYLADTAENQGAFTLIPGFQHKIADWVNSLPPDVNPRFQDLYALGPKPIAANAGDFIVWLQALPHGSSPNTSKLPRFVQYITYKPVDEGLSKVWK